jgi:hypothetical protein
MMKQPGVDRYALATHALNSTVAVTTGRMQKDGMLYGLELELEGRNVAMDGVASKNWKRVEDGSLRGESTEYVFTAPCDYPEAVKRVDALFKKFKENNVRLNNSYRTSTHVHLNFLDKTGKQVVNFFFIYTILEELLEHYCGEYRGGNLFCLSCRDNEELVDMLEQSLMGGRWHSFNNEVRYNAANMAALNKFGTIELRTMRGANTADEVNEWMEIVKHIYEYACSKDCPPPWRLVESLSHLGPMGFINSIFPAKIVDKLVASWPAAKDLPRSLMRGVRLIQMLAYKLEDPWSRPYEQPKPGVKQAKDPFPFGRPNDELRAMDRVALPNGGGNWNVPRFEFEQFQDGQVDPDGAVHWDNNLMVWKHGRKICKWLTFRGRPVIEGSIDDEELNVEWREENGIHWEDPEEDDWEPNDEGDDI